MLLKNVKLHLVLCSLLFVYSASAQKKSGKIKFGKVSQEELEMSSYPLDASAPGVVLYHRGKIENKYNDSQGFVMSYEEHKRIKILKKDAYDEANIQFFYHRNNEVKDIEAVCYNLENGKVTEVKLEKEQIFDEKITKSWRQIKFAIPGVKEGSVIDYKYRRVADDGIGFSDWVFHH